MDLKHASRTGNGERCIQILNEILARLAIEDSARRAAIDEIRALEEGREEDAENEDVGAERATLSEPIGKPLKTKERQMP